MSQPDFEKIARNQLEKIRELNAEVEKLRSEIREYKLLTREYFQAKSSLNHAPVDDWQRCRDLTKAIRDKERQILSELEDFTRERH